MHKPVAARQNNLLLLKGLLAVVWGVTALWVGTISPTFLILSFGILNFMAGILTMMFANANKHLNISHQWLLLEGITEFIAGIVFTFLVVDAESFVTFLSFGIVFIVILQFIYGFVLTIANKFHPLNLVARFISLIAGAAAAIVVFSNILGTAGSIVMVGVFSMIYGLLNMQFALKLKNVIMGVTE